MNYLHHSAPIAEALSNPRLISTTKVIQNFKNPKIEPRYSLREDVAAERKSIIETAKDKALNEVISNLNTLIESASTKVERHCSTKYNTQYETSKDLPKEVTLKWRATINSLVRTKPEIEAERAEIEEALRAYVNKATLGERSDADSHNSSSGGLPLESSERLSVSPLTSPKDVAKIGKNTEVTHRSAKNIINGGGLKQKIETPAQAISALGKGLHMDKSNSSQSYYGDFFEGDYIVDGSVVHLRISTHPATPVRMGNAEADHIKPTFEQEWFIPTKKQAPFSTAVQFRGREKEA